MKIVTYSLWLFGMALTGMPVVAAEHLDCALALRDASLDKAVFAEYRAGENIGEALMKERGQGFKACAAEHKWSGSATESAARILFGEILVAGVTQELIQFHLPVERLGAALAGFVTGQSPEAQRKLADGELDEATLTPLLEMLIDQRIVSEAQLTKEAGARIGEYLSAYANAAVYRKLFRTQ